MAEYAVKAIISGLVQGVWYRAHTQEEASKLGLTGYVRNLPDSTVEALFIGPRDKVDKAVAWCHGGSPGARVDQVKVTPLDDPPRTGEFTIRY